MVYILTNLALGGKLKFLMNRSYVAIFALCLFLAPRPILAGEATDQLRNTIQDFVNILTQTPVSELQATGLPEAARNLVFARFDFSEMTKLALGQHWKSLKVSEQEEFIAALANRMLLTYGRTVRSGGEKIQFKGEVQDGNRVTVDTEIMDSGEPVAINYRLHDVAGQWKVYDVVIGNVSIVKNFQAQFDRVIAKTSLKELLQKIKQIDS
jgi:phospholipid transport system substrate-binding protein